MQLTPQSELKQYFDSNGYVVIDTGLSHTIIDEVVGLLTPFFGDNRIEPQGVPFSDYGRVQDAWYLYNSISKVAYARGVLEVLRELYRAKPRPFQTLNFYKGTNQPTHADSIHFNCEPFGMMCGVWVALEDIGCEQGPLRIYPKSHLLEEMNYDSFNLEPTGKSYPKYLNEIELLIEANEYAERKATIKKGQAVVWAANTFHGGAPQTELALTRHSQVTHYYMGRPAAWRPSLSDKGRHYFEPEVVRDIKGWRHRLHCYRLLLDEYFSS